MDESLYLSQASIVNFVGPSASPVEQAGAARGILSQLTSPEALLHSSPEPHQEFLGNSCGFLVTTPPHLTISCFKHPCM